MKCERLGRFLRAKRLELGLRQADVALRAGVAQQVVSEVERGRVDAEKAATIDRIGLALGVPLGIVPLFDRAEMDRVLDARHAEVVEAFVARLEDGWTPRLEESFNVYGERGSADAIAWHEARRALAVVEVKTELTDVGETVRVLRRKARLLPAVLRERYGWRIEATATLLVLLETSSNRRCVTKYAGTFDSTFPLRGRAVARWLAAPAGEVAGLLFLSPTSSGCTRPRRRPRGGG